MAANPDSLRDLRKTFSLSQAEVAARLGIKQPRYAEIETGATAIESDLFALIWGTILEAGFDRGVAMTLMAGGMAYAALERADLVQ